MIVGIDNGLDGGLVALSPIAGLAPIAKFIMPTFTVHYPARKTSKARSVREVDSRALVAILDSLECDRKETVIFFEECPEHTFGASGQAAMRSMAKTMGMILAVLACKGFQKVRRITPADWQSPMLGKVPTGKTKQYAAAKASDLWPDESWLASDRSTVPHNGIIDAALIAEYGRRLTYPPAVPVGIEKDELPWRLPAE